MAWIRVSSWVACTVGYSRKMVDRGLFTRHKRGTFGNK